MNDKDVLDMFIEAGLVDLPDIELGAPWTVWGEAELSYNKEGNQEDLLLGDGETYAGEIKEENQLGEYVIFKIDSGCGWDYQVILSADKEIKDE